MRKQYYFRNSPRGLLAWDVDRLVELSRDLPVRAIQLSSIRELDEPILFDGSPATWRVLAAHLSLVVAADLAFPVILAADGALMDGRHRVAKALQAGRATIDAVQFAVDPPPDYVGRDPDDLPY